MQGGYASGAHARWRTLHEISVTAHFIKRYGNDVADRYLTHNAVESFKAMQQYQKYIELLNCEPYTDDEMKQIKQECEEACIKYGNNFMNDYGWAGLALDNPKPNFSNLEEHVCLSYLRPYYKMASHSVHAQPKGIAFNLGLCFETDDDIFLAGPSNVGMVEPGHSTAITLLQINCAFLTIYPNLQTLTVLYALLRLERDIGEAFAEVDEGFSR